MSGHWRESSGTPQSKRNVTQTQMEITWFSDYQVKDK